MSGKPYTLSEMKAIVDYLTEHKAYGEVKARKMWIDMQDSKITNRTWQSLKETFLKRILPDIHNPYYKLSLQQISSFRQGYDIQKKLNNKLQLRATTPDSNTDGENKKKSDDSDTNKDVTGEELKPSISNLRDSTETLVLEAIEDVVENNENTTKGLKNLDTYSEPLKSMIEAVFNDFTDVECDGSNDEPKMQIVETIENNQSEPEDTSEVICKPSQKTSNDDLYNILTGSNEMITKETKGVNVSSQVLSLCEVSSDNEGESINPKNSTSMQKASEENKNNPVTENARSLSKTPNSTNLTSDTCLPGNQEAFKKKLSVTDASNTFSETNHRKRRATSQDNSVGPSNSKKRSLNKNKQSMSDMEINTNNKEKVDLSKYRKQKIQEVEESSNAINGNKELLKDKETNNTSLISDEKISPEFENAPFQSRDPDQFTPNVESNVKQKLGDKCVNDNSEKEVTVSNNREVDNEEAEQKQHNPGPRHHRDWALTNLFGFTSGAGNRNRKRRKSFRRYPSSRNQNLNISTDSSAWTSDTGSEYISPPRGRKNKHGRKYMKPKSARILSLEEEGGLFAIDGKKIYPLVKNGKIVKNYINFIDEDDDSEASFWKLKYVKEKKKTQELTKLIMQVKEENGQESRLSAPTTSLQVSSTSDDDQKVSDRNQKINSRSSDNITTAKQAEENNAAVIDHKEVQVPEKDTVKIKFTVKNEEVELEGRSTLVNPLLAQVVQLLQNESNSVKLTPISGSVSSVAVAASDQEATERVNKLENEIFKEIVERDHGDKPHTDDVNKKSNEQDVTPNSNVVPPSEDQTEQNEIEVSPSENVTKRAGRMKRSLATPVKQTPVKKPKSDNESIRRRSTRTAKGPNTDNEDGNSTKTRRSTAKKSLGNNSTMIDEDSQVKFKFPSPTQSPTAKGNKKGMKSNNYQRKTKR